MAEEDSKGSHETNAVRLSFRAPESSYQKIVQLAKAKGWVNAKGRPNISAALNYIIDRFDKLEEVLPSKKKRSKKDG